MLFLFLLLFPLDSSQYACIQARIEQEKGVVNGDYVFKDVEEDPGEVCRFVMEIQKMEKLEGEKCNVTVSPIVLEGLDEEVDSQDDKCSYENGIVECSCFADKCNSDMELIKQRLLDLYKELNDQDSMEMYKKATDIECFLKGMMAAGEFMKAVEFSDRIACSEGVLLDFHGVSQAVLKSYFMGFHACAFSIKIDSFLTTEDLTLTNKGVLLLKEDRWNVVDHCDVILKEDRKLIECFCFKEHCNNDTNVLKESLENFTAIRKRSEVSDDVLKTIIFAAKELSEKGIIPNITLKWMDDNTETTEETTTYITEISTINLSEATAKLTTSESTKEPLSTSSKGQIAPEDTSAQTTQNSVTTTSEAAAASTSTGATAFSSTPITPDSQTTTDISTSKESRIDLSSSKSMTIGPVTERTFTVPTSTFIKEEDSNTESTPSDDDVEEESIPNGFECMHVIANTDKNSADHHPQPMKTYGWSACSLQFEASRITLETCEVDELIVTAEGLNLTLSDLKNRPMNTTYCTFEVQRIRCVCFYDYCHLDRNDIQDIWEKRSKEEEDEEIKGYLSCLGLEMKRREIFKDLVLEWWNTTTTTTTTEVPATDSDGNRLNKCYKRKFNVHGIDDEVIINARSCSISYKNSAECDPEGSGGEMGGSDDLHEEKCTFGDKQIYCHCNSDLCNTVKKLEEMLDAYQEEKEALCYFEENMPKQGDEIEAQAQVDKPLVNENDEKDKKLVYFIVALIGLAIVLVFVAGAIYAIYRTVKRKKEQKKKEEEKKNKNKLTSVVIPVEPDHENEPPVKSLIVAEKAKSDHEAQLAKKEKSAKKAAKEKSLKKVAEKEGDVKRSNEEENVKHSAKGGSKKSPLKEESQQEKAEGVKNGNSTSKSTNTEKTTKSMSMSRKTKRNKESSKDSSTSRRDRTSRRSETEGLSKKSRKSVKSRKSRKSGESRESKKSRKSRKSKKETKPKSKKESMEPIPKETRSNEAPR